MRSLLISIFVFCVSSSSLAQDDVAVEQLPDTASAVTIVQQQLEAYNNGDIDAFMAVFHKDISLWELNGKEPAVSGFKQVKKIYSSLFKASPALHSEVINRSVIGNKVLDYEIISGRSGSEGVFTLIMVYEIKDGKIWKATSIRP